MPVPIAQINPWLGGHFQRLADRPGLRVLDIGCGRGYWLEAMGAEGIDALGLEPDATLAVEARRHRPVAVADALTLPVPDASIDLVWCIHVLHHLHEPEVALREIRRVLRPGGSLLLAETVEDNPFIRLARRFWPRWDDVPVASRFRAADLGRWLRGADLDLSAWREHSVVAHAAYLLPTHQRRLWLAGLRAESRLLPRAARWGAHVEAVAYAPARSATNTW